MSKMINRMKSSSSFKSKSSSKLLASSSKTENKSAQNLKKFKINHNANYPILKKIYDDMNKFNPDTLMMQTNPLLNSTKTIEQIQMYYLGIQTELNKYQIQEQKKIMLTEKLVKLQSQIDQIVNPKKIISIQQIMEEARNYNYNNDKEKGTKTNISESKKENKPIIDYGAKIRVLEKELEYTYQGFNLIKAKNNKLISQLDELRKQNLYHLSKLNEMKKVVAKSDEKFTKDKTQVEENLSKKDEEKIYKQLLEKQKILNEVNLKMTENIKDINLEISKKKAKEKYLNFEKKKIRKKSRNYRKKAYITIK